MTAHVFVVSEETLPIHLKYMFAGTGAWDDGHENLWMISDVASCRVKDKIIFYLQWVGFFGIFEVTKEYFLDKYGETYMEIMNKKWEKWISKKLTNRILIKPSNVFKEPLPEWEILDNLNSLPNQKDAKIQDFLWSLLYRKLDWNRWCTPIFDYEFNLILDNLKKRNNNKKLNYKWFSYQDWIIIEWDTKAYPVGKSKDDVLLVDHTNGHYKYSIERKINIVKWLCWKKTIQKTTSTWKIRTQRSCEGELELYFSRYWNTDNEQGKSLKKIIGSNIKYFWTQVVCSFGAKRIDILTIDDENIFRVIELKDTEYYDGIIEDQLKYYICWLDQYIKEPLVKKIEPIIVIQETADLNITEIDSRIQSINEKYNITSEILPIKIFFWKAENWEIKFDQFKR